MARIDRLDSTNGHDQEAAIIINACAMADHDAIAAVDGERHAEQGVPLADLGQQRRQSAIGDDGRRFEQIAAQRWDQDLRFRRERIEPVQAVGSGYRGDLGPQVAADADHQPAGYRTGTLAQDSGQLAAGGADIVRPFQAEMPPSPWGQILAGVDHRQPGGQGHKPNPFEWNCDHHADRQGALGLEPGTPIAAAAGGLFPGPHCGAWFQLSEPFQGPGVGARAAIQGDDPAGHGGGGWPGDLGCQRQGLARTCRRHTPRMLREMFTAKLHRGAVSDVRIDYEGSLTVDPELIRRSGMLIHQKIQVLNISNGYRLETYLIPGGPGDMIINGAAARHAIKGDRLIVIAYGLLNEDEVKNLQPKVLVLNERNQIVSEH